jgi:glycosyltransferase involved in cell wall biosynthesis
MQVRHLADVIHSERIQLLYSRTYLMAMIAYGAARRSGVPWVTVEVADPKRALEDNPTRFLRAKRWLLGRAYRYADRVIANSEGVRQGLIDYYRLPAEATMTLYNFVDIERIDRQASLPGPVLEPDRFHVVCAGRLQLQKGYTFFLQAIDELVNKRGRKELVAHILGQGPLESELKGFAQARGLGSHVRFAGYVSHPCAYFKQAHLFCLASLYEGMPNALLEAMACRIPVLATDCPSGPREILEDGRLGRLVAPANAAALADAIHDALDNREKWLAIVPAARKRIEEDFSPSNGIARLEQLLKEVASGASHSR